MHPELPLNSHPNKDRNFFTTDKVVKLTGVFLIAILFAPFFSAILLATVAGFAYLGLKDRMRTIPPKKRYFVLGIVSVLLVTTLVLVTHTASETLHQDSEGSWYEKGQAYVLDFATPILILIKSRIISVLSAMDSSGSLQAKAIDFVDQTTRNVLNAGTKGILGLFSKIPDILLQLTFFIFLVTFIIRRSNRFVEQNTERLFRTYDLEAEFLFSAAKRSGYSAVVATLFTSLAQSLILTTGALIGGIKVWPVVFVLSFFSTMVPVVGIIPVAIPCIVYAWTEVSSTSGILMLCFAGMASVIDNLVRPLLVSGDESSLSPMGNFFALLGSLIVLGLPGLFVGPFIVVFASELLRKKSTLELHSPAFEPSAIPEDSAKISSSPLP